MSDFFTEVTVLGCGAVGSAALYELTRNNIKAIGIDQYGIAHNKGSSHGETRAMRQGYYDNASYIPILKKSYRQWLSFEMEIKEKLFEKVGVIEIGCKNSTRLNNIVPIAAKNDIAIEIIDSKEINYRYKGLRANDDMMGILENDGGYLYIEKIIKAQIQQASKLGAKILTEQNVLSWYSKGPSIIVKTHQHTINTEKLIICAGGWTNQLLHNLQLPLTLFQKGLYWFHGTDIHKPIHMPVFSFDRPEGFFYGFPAVQGNVKVARHSGGKKIDLPEAVSYDQEEQDQILNFTQKHINGMNRDLIKKDTCFYTSTPDENFIIDFLPNNSNVMLAAGLSGHGFKMSNMLGYYLAAMAITGRKEKDIDFLSLKRFGMAND